MEFHAGFALAVSQNKYLSTGDTEMQAVLTVTSTGLTDAHAPAPEAAEVIVIDCSGSMSNPPTKIGAARRATEAAIDALREGVYFAVVEGTQTARTVYPAEGGLVAATPETTSAAKKAVRHLAASGGTAMGAWLRLADELLATRPAAVRHAMLLTDGQNLPSYQQGLDDALQECAGRFVCDGRGIGDDYAPADLLRIAAALHGTADAIVEDDDLVPEFAAMMTAAMGKAVPVVRLLVRTMAFARLSFVRQMYPTEIDLTPFGETVDERTTAFSTGSWGAEEREFHVGIEVDRPAKHPVDKDIQTAKVELAVVRAGGTEATPAAKPRSVLVQWTRDVLLSSMVDLKVAHYTSHKDLGKAVKAGCDAHASDKLDDAAVAWGHAVAMAARLGHDAMLTRLRRLVDIVGDPRNGEVVVKEDLRPRAIFSAMLGSAASTHSPDGAASPGAEHSGPDQRCAHCDYLSPPTANVCERCERPLGKTA